MIERNEIVNLLVIGREVAEQSATVKHD